MAAVTITMDGFAVLPFSGRLDYNCPRRCLKNINVAMLLQRHREF
jgi:hypothetical protein